MLMGQKHEHQVFIWEKETLRNKLRAVSINQSPVTYLAKELVLTFQRSMTVQRWIESNSWIYKNQIHKKPSHELAH